MNHLCDDPDIIVLNVTSPGLQEFKLMNIYNEKRHGEVIGEGYYTIKKSLQHLNIQGRILIYDDFNAYY